jgi:hypothetical protein
MGAVEWIIAVFALMGVFSLLFVLLAFVVVLRGRTTVRDVRQRPRKRCACAWFNWFQNIDWEDPRCGRCGKKLWKTVRGQNRAREWYERFLQVDK